MKSGTKNLVIAKTVHFRLRDYAGAHSKEECSGKWKPIFEKNDYFAAGALGPMQVSCIPYIECDQCEARYYMPGFQDWVEDVIAHKLVLNKGLLNKKQLRFLRQYFDLTQEQVADKLGLTGRHYYSRVESENSVRQMSPETQFRLKVLYAKMLGISDADQIYELLDAQDSYAKIMQEDLPKATEIIKRFKAA